MRGHDVGCLHRHAGQRRLVSQHVRVDSLVSRPLAAGVRHDEMPVGIDPRNVPGHVPMLLDGLRVLLGEIPVERRLVAEAGNQFAQVQLPLAAQFTIVHRHRVHTAVVSRILSLGQLEVQVHPLRRPVIEHDAPLVEFRAVEPQSFVTLDVRPDVVAIASRRIREKRKDVQPLAREIVDGTDEPFAFASPPRRVALAPVLHMRTPRLERLIVPIRPRAVEIDIGQQCLGGIGSRLQKVLTRLGKAEIPLADVLQPTLRPQVPSGLVRGRDLEGPGVSIEVTGALPGVVTFVDSHIGTAAEVGPVRPGPGLIRGEVHAPHGAGIGTGVAGIPIGGVVARHLVALPASFRG